MGGSLIRILTILIILTVSFLGSCQSVFNTAFDVNNAPNFSGSVLETDNGYIFTQRADYIGFSHIQAIKLDTLGNITDSNTLVQSDTALFNGFSGSLQKLTTPEFCQLYKVGPDSVIRLVFFDINLQKIRETKYHFNQFTGRGIVKQINDSTLLLLGQVTNPNYWDLVLINTDLQGNERWRTIFGELGKDDYGFSIGVLNDTIVVGGQTLPTSSSSHPHIWLFDSLSNPLFDTIYSDFSSGGYLAHHNNFGWYLSAAKNVSNKFYPSLIKLNPDLSISFSKDFFTEEEYVSIGQHTINDDGVITAAGMQIVNNVITGIFFQANHLGDSLGSKLIDHISGERSQFHDIRPTSDGGYIMVGETRAPGQDSWIVKVNAWGCDNIPCVVSVGEVELPIGELNCYPNPTHGSGTISGYLSSLNKESEVKVYNSVGQLIQRIPVAQNQFEFQTQFPATGLYLISLETNGEIIKQQKWVVH